MGSPASPPSRDGPAHRRSFCDVQPLQVASAPTRAADLASSWRDLRPRCLVQIDGVIAWCALPERARRLFCYARIVTIKRRNVSGRPVLRLTSAPRLIPKPRTIRLDADRVERKDNSPVIGLLQDDGIEQCVHVAMHAFHIALHLARQATNR